MSNQSNTARTLSSTRRQNHPSDARATNSRQQRGPSSSTSTEAEAYANASNGSDADYGERRWFNSGWRGLGYLNSIDDIGKDGKSRYVVKLACFQGPDDEVEYVYFSTIVTSVKVLELLRQYEEQINHSDIRVNVAFRVTNPKPRSFLYPPGHAKAGEIGVSMNGFLSAITSMKIDGELVYTQPASEYEEDTENVSPTPSAQHGEQDWGDTPL